jgi:hypothetical protein
VAKQSDGRGPRRIFLIVALIAVVAVAFAFGWWAFTGDGSDESADLDQTGRIATPEVADEAAEDIENPVVASGFPTGRFINEDGSSYVVFWPSPDGTFVANFNGYGFRGTYTVDGELYTEVTTDIQPLTAPATYRWSYTEGELAFELVGEDTQPNRRSFYTGNSFQGRVFVLSD